MARRARKPAHTGILKVDKPGGMTSHDVVQTVRRRMGQREVGHTGTLDPMATGLLVLTLGKATRLGRFLEAAEKAYTGTVVFGQATDTYDAEGVVLREVDVPPMEAEKVAAVVASFRGPLEQRVPAFSAVKVGGERLHAKARRGDAVELPIRQITIHDIRMTAWSSPRLDIEVVCSKGTYIRTLATQIGDALSLPAHLGRLRRVRVGPHGVGQAVAPDACGPEDLIGMANALRHLPQLQLGDADVIDVQHGRPLTFAQVTDRIGAIEIGAEDPIALLDPDGNLVAVAYATVARSLWSAQNPADRALRYACVLSA